MARLFITPRELDLVSDWTKEIIKDVIGQKIYYYSVSESKSIVHDVYLESPEKIFESPLELDALVEWHPSKVKVNEFGVEDTSDIKVWVHARDIIDKNVNLSVGDFFSFGDAFFEITQFIASELIHGQVEHKAGYEIMARQARQTQFVTKVFGPTDEKYSDSDAVQETFVQQRGLKDNRLGPTGDVRELQKKELIESPENGPREISKRGPDSRTGSTFYDE